MLVFSHTTHQSTSRQNSHPLRLLFGRRAVLPVDISKNPLNEKPEMKEFDDDQIDLVMEKRKERLGVVKENILNAQKKQKELYDRKH